MPLERFQQDAAHAVDELVTLGCRYAVVPSLPASLQGLDRVGEVARLFGAWAARCADAGLRFAYHNHDFELRVRDERGTSLLELLIAATDPALVSFELDVLWAHVGGAEPRDLLGRHAGRIALAHVKDAGRAGGDAPFGAGSLPWDELLPAAQRAGVEWYVVEQDEPEDPLRDVETSLRNLSARLSDAP
jgi:sugar phosphate isomerase/epimerase